MMTGARSKEELRHFLLARLASDLLSVKSQNVWNEKKALHDHWLLILTDFPATRGDWLILSSMLASLIEFSI